MLNCIFVGLGGFIGAVMRYLIGLIPLKPNEIFPFKTLIINILGAFAIGIISAIAARRNINQNIVLILQTGVCGGFTTFSTFAYETSGLIKSGNTVIALIYIILSIVFCILAVFAAQAIVKHFI
ncbi:MAG: fluoride efflux transporter CrcB [Eubacterium sp.]